MSSQDINSSGHRRTKSAGDNNQSSSALAFGHSPVQSTDNSLARPGFIGLGLSSVDLEGDQKPNVARSQAGIPAQRSSQDGPGQSASGHQGDDALVSAGIRRLSRASAAEQATAFGTLVPGPSRLATIVSTPANIMHGLTDQEATVRRSVSGSYTALPEHAQLQGRHEEREDAQSEHLNPHTPVGMGQEMYGRGSEEDDLDEEPNRLEAFGIDQQGRILLTRGITGADFVADQAQIWDDAVATSASRKQRKEEEEGIAAEGSHRRFKGAVQLPRLETAAARMKSIAMMNRAQERARRLTELHGGDPFLDSRAPPFDFPALAPASQVPVSRPRHQEGLVSGRSFCTPGPSNSNVVTHQRVPLADIALGSQPFLPQAVDNRGGILDGRSPSIYSVETGHWPGQAAAVDGGPATAKFDSVGGYPEQSPFFSGNQSRNPSSSEVRVKSGSAPNEFKVSRKGKGKEGETVVKASSASSESLLSTSTKENRGSGMIHDDNLVQGFGSASNKGKGKMTEYLPVVQVGDTAVESISETPALPEGEDVRRNPRLALPWESPSAPRPPPLSPAAEAPSPGPTSFPLGVSTDVALMAYENYDAGIEGPKTIGLKVKGGLRGWVAGVKGKIKPSLTKEKRPTAPSAASVSVVPEEEEGPLGSRLRDSTAEFLAGFSSKPRHGSVVTRWPGRVSSLAAHSSTLDSPSLWHAKNKPLPSAPIDRGHFSPYENDSECGVRFAEDRTVSGAATAQFEKATLVAALKRANIKCQEAESRAGELEHNLLSANAENEALRRQVWVLGNRITEMEVDSDHFEEDLEAAVMAERRDMGHEIARLAQLNAIARAELDGISQKNVLLNRDLGYHLGTIAELRLQLGQQPQQQEPVANEEHIPYFRRPDLRHKHMGVFHPLSSARVPVGPGHPNFSPTLAPRRPRVKKSGSDNNQRRRTV